MKFILIVIACLLTETGFSQLTDTTLINGETIITFYANSPADSLRKQGDVEAAIVAFQKMCLGRDCELTELYNYACALSLDYQIDSAFKYLIISTAEDNSIYALTDPDFLNLRKDKRWDDFETKLIANFEAENNNPIKDLDFARKLWAMEASDQAYFDCIDLAEQKIGRNSTVVLALWKLKSLINEENQKELEQLIDMRGWPKISQVGQEAAGAAFLIIQHSNPEKQKKYLPTIKLLCEEHEANWQSYALMYDRIQTSENLPQKYGSQIRFNTETNSFELFPLMDETRVDEWRKEVGLGPLADYVVHWGIEFKPKEK